MTTYVYETIPDKISEKPKYYQIKQNMTDLALFRHPETGEQIRRVVVGGIGILKKGQDNSSNSCCGPSGCC